MIRDHIKEEVYFRETMRLSLDAEDPIIRRQLRSKMEFLATAEVENATPNDVELKHFLATNKARYSADPTYSFDQQYYGEDEANTQSTIAALNAGQSPPVLLIPLSAAMEQAPADDIAREFSDDFVNSLRWLPTAKWSGAFGLWLARHPHPLERAATAPPLVEVRRSVTNDWRAVCLVTNRYRARCRHCG